MYPIEFFWRSVTRFADRPAIVSPEGLIDYRTLGRLVNRRAQAVLVHDPAPGSPVALGGANSVEHVVALLAIMTAAKAWIPLNPRSGDPELLRIVEFAQPGLVLADEAVAQRLAESTSTVRTFAELDETPVTNSDVPMGASPSVAVPLDRPQAIKFTGGTTGVPKGVLQSYRTWNTNIVSQIHAYGLDRDDRYLVAAPITHGTGTYVLPLLASGGALVFPAQTDAAGLLDAAEHGAVTMFFGPPTLLLSLAAEQLRAPRDLRLLRHVVYGGAPMRADQIRATQRAFGPVMCATYGQTEAPQIVTFLPPDAMVGGDLDSVGPPSIFTQAAIFDGEGRGVACGEAGEVCVRGDLVMTGYLHADDETANVFRDGWLRTGDIGAMDERGYLFLRGRLRDVIITGGFNVYPSDVEHVLVQHPAVREAVVLGVPDEKWGEAVHAVIQLHDDRRVVASELTAMVRRELGPVKTPKAIHVFGLLPRSPVGKVRKSDLVLEIQRRRSEGET